jgi:hypothetical protein
MATIANQNGRHMVQHVLFPVNIHFLIIIIIIINNQNGDRCHGNQGAKKC